MSSRIARTDGIAILAQLAKVESIATLIHGGYIEAKDQTVKMDGNGLQKQPRIPQYPEDTAIASISTAMGAAKHDHGTWALITI